MKTRKSVNKILADILEKTEMNPEIEALVSQVRDEISARDTALQTACEPWDNDAEEDFEPVFKNNGGEDYKGKYETLKQQYIDRFFNGDPSKAPEPNPEPEPSILEPEPKQISELFKEV